MTLFTSTALLLGIMSPSKSLCLIPAVYNHLGKRDVGKPTTFAFLLLQPETYDGMDCFPTLFSMVFMQLFTSPRGQFPSGLGLLAAIFGAMLSVTGLLALVGMSTFPTFGVQVTAELPHLPCSSLALALTIVQELADFFIHLRRDELFSVPALKQSCLVPNLTLTVKGMDLSSSSDFSLLLRNFILHEGSFGMFPSDCEDSKHYSDIFIFHI